MKLIVAAVGRLKDGAERTLADRYVERFEAAGKRLGFQSLKIVELPESRHGDVKLRVDDEAQRLLAAIAGCEIVVVLDETGKSLSSVDFAEWLKKRRDGGSGTLALVIGGPDGHGPALRERADLTLSLGAMTWPHGLARVLLLEQLYRATTILSGHPYHRV